MKGSINLTKPTLWWGPLNEIDFDKTDGKGGRPVFTVTFGMPFLGTGIA